MKRVLIIIMLLFVASTYAPLQAQSGCFANKVKNGKTAMEKKDYKRATRFFNEALNTCDDRNDHKSEFANVRKLMKQCEEKLNPKSKKEDADNKTNVTVTSKAKKASTLTIDKKTSISEQVGRAASEHSYTVATDGSAKWTVVSSVDFITVEQSKNNTLVMRVAANDKVEVRQGEVTVSIDSLVATIKVVQEAAIDTTPRVEIALVPSTDVKQNQSIDGGYGITLKVKAHYLFLKDKQVKLFACFVDEQQRRIGVQGSAGELRSREQAKAIVPTSDDFTKEVILELPYEYVPLTLKQGEKIGVYFDILSSNHLILSTKNLAKETAEQKRYYYFTYEEKQQIAQLGTDKGKTSIKDNVSITDGERVVNTGQIRAAGNGLKFHVKYSLSNMLGHKAVFAVLLFDKDGNPLVDELDNYYNLQTEWANRHVATYDTLGPLTVDNTDGDFMTGIPYRQIPLMNAGKAEIKYKIAIFDVYEGKSKLLMVTPDFGSHKFSVNAKDVQLFLLVDGSHNRAVVELSKESGSADTLQIRHNCTKVDFYGIKKEKLDKNFDIQFINNNSALVIRSLYANTTGQTRGGIFTLRAFNDKGEYVDTVDIDLRQLPTTIQKTVKQKAEAAPVNLTVERSGWNVAQAMSSEQLNKHSWNEQLDKHWFGISFGYRQRQWVTAGGKELGPFSEWDPTTTHTDGLMGGLRFTPQIGGLAGFGFDLGIFYEFCRAQSNYDLTLYPDNTAYRIAPQYSDKWGGSYMELQSHCVYVPLHLKFNANFYKWFSIGVYGGIGLNYTVAGRFRFRRKNSYDGETLIKSYDIDRFYDSEYINYLGDGYVDASSQLNGSKLGEKFTYPGGWKELNTTFDVGASLRLAMFQFDVSYSIGLSDWNTIGDTKVSQNYPLTTSVTILF